MDKNALDATTSQFESFWESSAYSRYNVKEFAAAQELYGGKEKAQAILEYPSIPKKLVLPKSKVNSIAKQRRSDRTFSAMMLTAKEFGLLLSSFYAYNGSEHRSYPSAGASYAVEIFCVTNQVEGFERQLLYYNPDLHAVSMLGDAPSWEILSTNINVVCQGTPQCVIIFVLISSRLTAKYRERGGRFAVIEAGAAMQQLSNQIANSKTLKGVAAGGLNDGFWLNLLGLYKNEAKIALGYMCGK